MAHDCQYIVDFDMDREGEPIFCGQLAAVKYGGAWFCAGHYDIRMDEIAAKTGYVYRQGAS